MMRPPDALPLHLMLAWMQSAPYLSGWSGSSSAWPHWNLPGLNLGANGAWPFPGNENPWAMLSALWQANPSAPPHPGAQALGLAAEAGEAAFNQAQAFLDGLNRYLDYSYTREVPHYPVLWQSGAARLLDPAPAAREGVAILMLPSLINPAYILDLMPGASLLQHLVQRGMRPCLLDWGAPQARELEFSTADYIETYALAALETLRHQHDGPIVVLGYCMGGIFALALAQLAPIAVDGLVLLATPWDFHSDDAPGLRLDVATQALFRQWIGQSNPVPPWVIQFLFHCIDPWRVQRKFAKFPQLSGDARTRFLATEQWVNDGIPLARAVAQECFIDWPQANILARHQWKIGRRWIDPAAVRQPALAVIPRRDLIVPEACARALVGELGRTSTLTPEGGHVSMLSGQKAQAQLYDPLADWLEARF